MAERFVVSSRQKDAPVAARLHNSRWIRKDTAEQASKAFKKALGRMWDWRPEEPHVFGQSPFCTGARHTVRVGSLADSRKRLGTENSVAIVSTAAEGGITR